MEEDVKVSNMTKRQLYKYEYARTPEVMERARKESIRKSKAKKVVTTMSRFEEHTMDELMSIVAAKCLQKGINYDLVKEDFFRLMSLLHDPI